ncbi:energy transducer TonB [Rhodoplanes sp. TEM]|uniref:Energy transducer TonB n=1 Tax=Rhodoplanes tepidamans TaxID=200616 RepID=A0ABT5J8K0_RHOTP|nr:MULTISPECIES: energy transducer TonB [Rhodoplanes]MDC7785823.1 energy transducer TonB [Rhodoplanes tepidamans]MDC7984090.1 energy transducer TonB [Rhodoplanes sp. TEM]MDQ0354614.1 protein TonB [Rhodoplanes tepidamans]
MPQVSSPQVSPVASDLRPRPAGAGSAPDLRAPPEVRPAPPPGRAVDVPLPEGDNIVPFRRPAGTDTAAAPAAVAEAHRPAPLWRHPSRTGLLIGTLAASIAAHAALYALFDRPVTPLASIGVESVSVELVLGADSAAGTAATPGPEEAESSAAATPAGPPDGPETAPPPEAPQEPPQEPVATAEAPPPAETAVEQPAEQPPPPAPVERVLTTEMPAAETAAVPAPPEKPQAAPTVQTEPVPVRPPKPKVAKPSAAKPRGRAGTETRVAVAAPSAGSSGIGIGRSDAHSNYPGLVAAHLARHKRYPAEARSQGQGGTATVRFTLDGGGRVTGVTLLRGSGNPHLDRESVEVVRRASPFPAPPDGHGRGFTQPIRFGIH